MADNSTADKFDPFFDRFAAMFRSWMFPKFSFPLLMGAAYYAVHLKVFAGSKLDFYPGLLAIVIIVIPWLVFAATIIFKKIFQQMDNRISTGTKPFYLAKLNSLLTDWNFFLSGILFGAANPFAAWLMGVEFENARQAVTISVGFFLTGAACGVAVWGVYGIVSSIRTYAQKDSPRYDFTAPDGCGGVLFIGHAVTLFGVIALAGGALISTYIFTANDALQLDMGGDALSAKFIFVIWVVVPYILSSTVLLAPTLEIHNSLHKYKFSEEKKIETKLIDLTERFETEAKNNQAKPEVLKALRLKITRVSERRIMLHQMSTWPFGVNTQVKIALLMVANGLWTSHKASGTPRLKDSIANLMDILNLG